MKIVIFAGGVGTRLWPLSRQQTPKQFEKIIGNKSTLQLAVERLFPEFKMEDIYIATGKRYEKVVRSQLPQLVHNNLILEPEMRDVGPAVGLAMTILAKDHPDTPTAILWSDHFVKKDRRFREVLNFAEKLVKEENNRIVLIGQRARFANQNLGWTELGQEIREVRGTKIFQFKRHIYRPTLAEAERFLASGNFTWNPGYFVSTPRFILEQYKKFAPSIWQELQKFKKRENIEKIYPKLPKISFDTILEKIDPRQVLVIAADLGWSDVGAWEALKEALEVSSSENITRGKVLIEDSSDNLIFNYTDQLTVGIDLKNLIVINTDDVLLICHKNSVPKIKKLVESLAGTEHEHLT
ncbi:mannose-1-phosphate guanylyltransferase [Candidatus Microgenomates bacterium]|nr:mannose-1-phosphate guanylyltransferase [Candidatus Microgenomates bacterium]